MKNVLERLINLLAMLLTAARPVTAEQIRRTIPGYSRDSDEAFHRMFERDKELLRSIGIPLEMTFTDGWEIEQGYRIDPDKYSLPDPGLTDEERAALLLAAQVVRLGGEPAAPEAVLKLGGARLTGAAEPLSADLGEGAALGDLFLALSERRQLRFDYRGRRRRVNPYGLGHRRGHWYLVGGTAEGERMFRVDRMEQTEVDATPGTFTRPEGFSIADALTDLPWEVGSEGVVEAKVRFGPEVAWWAARQLGAWTDEPVARKTRKDGSLIVTVPVANVDAFLGWLLSFGDGAEVLSPPKFRQAVVERVKAAG
ncbi:MAG: WYL domain-containing protein [Acidimicrobiia bacterium]|nr:WYL domain-containing protein [Acidimicrobiia bacterium]